MITVNRLYQFSASHRLHVPSLGDAANREMFGKCNNPFGHGHNYGLEVSVIGEINPETGRAVDLTELDRLVSQAVLDRYDHRYLNTEIPAFAHQVPTTENLGSAIQTALLDAWPAVFPSGLPRLQRLRIFETERNIFEVAPPGASIRDSA